MAMACMNVVYKCKVKGCNYETSFPNKLSKHNNHYKGLCGDEPLLPVAPAPVVPASALDPSSQPVDCDRQLTLDVEEDHLGK